LSLEHWSLGSDSATLTLAGKSHGTVSAAITTPIDENLLDPHDTSTTTATIIARVPPKRIIPKPALPITDPQTAACGDEPAGAR
jgi:hypothetical protein